MPISNIPEGVLNSVLTLNIAGEGVIKRRSGGSIAADVSSLDLHVSDLGWELQGSVKQTGKDEEVESVCEKIGGKKFELHVKGTKLRKGHVYVLKLDENIDFSEFPWLYGEATGKSTIGRIDVLTRLLANRSPSYDYIPPKYEGDLYVEVIPISFDIIVYPGNSLNQLRIHCGPMKPLESLVGWRLLYALENGRYNLAAPSQEVGSLSLNLEPTEWGGLEIVALRSIKTNEPVDFAVANEEKQNRANPHHYFEPIESKDNQLLIEKDRFYILRSIERLALTIDIAVTGFAYTEHLGEVRIHYAGFAHPFFGMDREDEKVGAPLIFEVRAHNFPVYLRHGEKFATIRFYKMAEDIPPEQRKPCDYSNQELTLSKYFRDP